MPKIGIVPNFTRDKAPEITLKVTEQLRKLNIEYFFDKSLLNLFPVKIDSDNFTEGLYERSDIIIAIGGDGSFIHTAKQAAIHKKPVLCINAGNLAFLAGLEGNELGLLEKLISGDYVTDKRMMLKAVMKNSDCEMSLGYCLNDVAAARGAEIRLIDIDIFCDGRKINNYRADGVIISTPTGSTAYSWSAGGPVIDPQLECMTLTPICTHSPLNRSLVFSGDSVITIKPHKGCNEFSVSTDGENSITVSDGAEIIISKSELFAEFIRIKSDEFFDILNSKLKVGRTDEKETT
ncbi:MAG: NAD(+)/NADH kinase [Oscillospiraceae bacterium]|nr:NAD(+)/NADH kinase [Oscillospiraceae bacterium]